MELRNILRGQLGSVGVSFKKTSRTREKGVFRQAIDGLKLAVGEFAFVSHKEWLDSLTPEVRENLTAGSNKNGPRYSLSKDYDCVAGNLSGSDLEAVAESEERELSDSDIIYSITPKPKIVV